MTEKIKIQDSYYISANSTYADNRVHVANNEDTFGVFDHWGDVNLIGKETQGIFHAGTRFVSELEFKINGERPVLLSSAVNDVLHADLTNPDFIKNGKIYLTKGTIHISRAKFVENGLCHENITLVNYDREEHVLDFSFTIDADFKDIFEVRGTKREKRGQVSRSQKSPQTFTFIYTGLDNKERRTNFRFFSKPNNFQDQDINYRITLKPLEPVKIGYCVYFEIGENIREKEVLSYTECHKRMTEHLEKEKKEIADIFTDNELFNEWFNQARIDLISLTTVTPHGRYPYAGVPWYNTPFGRDGIITALQVLWVRPEIAKGVLLYLAETQAKVKDDYKDSEPGKIFHETREGEMAELGEIPFKLYYGTVDATPLFIVLAGAYYQQTADLDTIKKIWPNIEAALNWIKDYGDLDGDGFIEYQHQNEKGLFNQGWKDSFDSISHKNGELAESPIALCEVQGYVYDGKIKAALIAEALGKKELSESLKGEAKELKKKFNEVFWDEELQTFVLALDGKKKPCRVKASNVGHCLYSGIVEEKYASHVAQMLLKEDMFSQWGIRTLSSEEVRFNPMSYHNGSVWPHDNGITAMGLARYKRWKEVLKIFNGLYEANLYFELQRLPELFCGFEKRSEKQPVEYPVACSPQAWAVGALFMLIKACIKIDINSIEKKVTFYNPELPYFLDFISLDNLPLGDDRADIHLQKHPVENGFTDVTIKVIKKPADWEIIIVK